MLADVSVHAFVDESRRGKIYLLAATLLPPGQVDRARTLVRGLCLPGERRIHFHTEPDPRRKLLISSIVASGMQSRVYVGTGRPDRVRSACMAALISDLAKLDAGRLVLESRGYAQDRIDRADIHLSLVSAPNARIGYEHMRPHEEPILSVSDGVAWAYGAGGDWRRRISPALDMVSDLGIITGRRP